MSINQISIKNSGYVLCKSSFYTVTDVLDGRDFDFTEGINLLHGDIDSGIFGISYLMSMYKTIDVRTLFMPQIAMVDGKQVPLSDLAQKCCYMDLAYPLFSSKKSLRSLVDTGLKKSGLSESTDEILRLFAIQRHNVNRAVSQMGNEGVKAMAAVAYSHGKDVFCFPWLSKMRYESFNSHLPAALDILESLGKTVVLPLGR